MGLQSMSEYIVIKIPCSYEAYFKTLGIFRLGFSAFPAITLKIQDLVEIRLKKSMYISLYIH